MERTEAGEGWDTVGWGNGNEQNAMEINRAYRLDEVNKKIHNHIGVHSEFLSALVSGPENNWSTKKCKGSKAHSSKGKSKKKEPVELVEQWVSNRI
jgi:hypothetical protein